MTCRRSALAALGALLVLAGAGLATAAVRPPAEPATDAFGHAAWWAPSASCTLSWVDLTASGAPLTPVAAGAGAPADDDGAALLTLAAPLWLYDTTVTALAVSTNGLLADASAGGSESGADFSNDCPLPAVPEPGRGAEGRILALHDELEIAPGGGLWTAHFEHCPRPSEALGDEPCTVVEWRDMRPAGSSDPAFSFQAVLYHASAEIVLQYGAGVPAGSATIGLQADGAREAVVASCDQPALSPAGDAVCFYDPRFPADGPSADLAVGFDFAPPEVTPGETAAWTFTVTDRGPSPAAPTAVSAAISAGLTSCSWTCEPDAGSSCTAGPVSGPLMDVVELRAGGAATYDLECTVDPAASGSVSIVAGAAPPAGWNDPAPGDESAVSTVTVASGSQLFADGFESGSTAAWSATVP